MDGRTLAATIVRVLSAGAVQAMVEAIGDEFSRATGQTLDLNFAPVGTLRARLQAGERADLVIMSVSAIDVLEKTGAFRSGSRVELGRTVTGVAIADGAPLPDISTVEAFKQTLLEARAVSYSDPKVGGSSGVFFAGLLDRLGIADEVNRKSVLKNRGHEVAEAVASGEADIGTTFVSEILTVKGAQVAGPLPGELHNTNAYAGAVPTGSRAPELAAAFLRALADPATRARWTAAGLEPAF